MPRQRRAAPALAARAGWRTLGVTDADSALATLETRDGMLLDAILIDQAIPGGDTAALISRIRDLRPDLPILMLTALSSVEIAVEVDSGKNWGEI